MKEMCCGERNIDIDDDGFFLDGLDLNRDRWRFGFCCGFVCLLFFLDDLDLNRDRWRLGFCCGLVDRCFLLNGLDLNRDRWRFSFCCRLIDLLLFLLDRLEHIQTKIRLQHRLVWLLLLLMHQFVTIQKEYRKETTITIRTLICLFRKHEFISYSIHSPILFHTRFGDVLQTRWSLNRLYFTIYKREYINRLVSWQWNTRENWIFNIRSLHRVELNLINTVLSKRYFVLVQHRRWKCIQLMDESLSLSSIYMFMFL